MSLFWRNRASKEMRPDEVQRVVKAYGAALEGNSGSPVYDITCLPYPKEKIKAALIFAIRVTSDVGMRDHLRGAYVSLADFQSLAPEEKNSLKVWETMGSSDDDLMQQASKIATGGAFGLGAQRRATEEAAMLLEELKSIGLWENA